MPAPKPLFVKDLRTQQVRKFRSQYAADEFYGRNRGYFKDVINKLGGSNRKFEVWRDKEV